MFQDYNQEHYLEGFSIFIVLLLFICFIHLFIFIIFFSLFLSLLFSACLSVCVLIVTHPLISLWEK